MQGIGQMDLVTRNHQMSRNCEFFGAFLSFLTEPDGRECPPLAQWRLLVYRNRSNWRVPGICKASAPTKEQKLGNSLGGPSPTISG